MTHIRIPSPLVKIFFRCRCARRSSSSCSARSGLLSQGSVIFSSRSFCPVHSDLGSVSPKLVTFDLCLFPRRISNDHIESAVITIEDFGNDAGKWRGFRRLQNVLCSFIALVISRRCQCQTLGRYLSRHLYGTQLRYQISLELGQGSFLFLHEFCVLLVPVQHWHRRSSPTVQYHLEYRSLCSDRQQTSLMMTARYQVYPSLRRAFRFQPASRQSRDCNQER